MYENRGSTVLLRLILDWTLSLNVQMCPITIGFWINETHLYICMVIELNWSGPSVQEKKNPQTDRWMHTKVCKWKPAAPLPLSFKKMTFRGWGAQHQQLDRCILCGNKRVGKWGMDWGLVRVEVAEGGRRQDVHPTGSHQSGSFLLSAAAWEMGGSWRRATGLLFAS